MIGLMAERSFSFSKGSTQALGPHSLLFNELKSPFPGTVRPGREADHSASSRPNAKTAWSCTSSPLCFHYVNKENIILLETKNDSTVRIKFNFML